MQLSNDRGHSTPVVKTLQKLHLGAFDVDLYDVECVSLKFTKCKSWDLRPAPHGTRGAAGPCFTCFVERDRTGMHRNCAVNHLDPMTARIPAQDTYEPGVSLHRDDPGIGVSQSEVHCGHPNVSSKVEDTLRLFRQG